MLSIIIPTFNEADQIAETIRQTQALTGVVTTEIIVSDGGSTDETVSLAKSCGATVVRSERKGRAAQLNSGASKARGDIFYFLHADSIPPKNFTGHINHALENGAASGCFRLAFDYTHWFLRANCWFTRFNVNAVRFGDQSLFITKAVFNQSGGYREDLIIMEDQEIIHRLKKQGKFVVMPANIITSARKYLDNGIYNMQYIFFRIWCCYYLGYSQQRLVLLYKSLIRKHKI